MIYTVRKDFVRVLGNGWLSFDRNGFPAKPYPSMAGEIPLTESDLKQIGDYLTRANIEHWLATNSGDFSSITDWSASIGSLEIPFLDDENEMTYNDITDPYSEMRE
jgi:hypothetical protein